MKKHRLYSPVIIIVSVIIFSVWLFFGNNLELGKPEITFDHDIKAVGRQQTLTISFTDAKSGLSYLNVEIIQDNKGRILAEKRISQKNINREVLPLEINTAEIGLHDGPAALKITAMDHSLFKNKTVLLKDILIDTVPPRVNLLKNMTYINQGGTGFVAYDFSKPVASTGIYVNDYFTPGFGVSTNDKIHYVVYFPLPMDAGKKSTRITIFARDEAGNETKIALPFMIREKKFRSDRMNLSDNFLQQKMPEFQSIVPSLRDKSLLDVFIYVNSEMRKENFLTIQKICGNSSPRKLWDGAFLRMRNAAPMALFGDKRYYVYNKKTVAESVHEGVDLASVAAAPIEAANKGIVVFTGFLGIYGNTVIIDHGMGLFSLYAHLSAIETKVGRKVNRGEKIGLSGLSGLAGGDHLHFSMIAGGQFVNPQEWWDGEWIKNNITHP